MMFGKARRSHAGSMKMSKFAVGVDLGGTQLRASVVDLRNGTLHTPVIAVPSRLGTARGADGKATPAEINAVMTAIAQVVADVVKNAGLKPSDLAGIGLAVPDPVTADGQLPTGCTTMLGWDGINVKRELERRLGGAYVKYWIGNDVNAHALGELKFGLGRDNPRSDFVYFSVGTGIAAGLILDGRLRAGV